MTSAGKPNIVFVLVDDQGYGDFSAQGHPVLDTPELDRLASESVRFTDFHVSPMCSPTRGSLLTGLDPLRHGAMNVSSGRSLLRPDAPTLADLLRDNGYRTGIFGKWHLGDSYPFRPQDRGFEDVMWFPSSHITGAADYWNNDYFDTWLREINGEVRQQNGYCSDIFFGRAMSWIEKCVADGQPFFAYVPLNTVHRPWLVEDRYREPYRHLGHELATYCGMVANIDENIGLLDRELTKLGVRNDTILVYMSDNGPAQRPTELFNAGMRGHKGQLWEGGHRVPFLLRWSAAGIENRDINQLTTAQDFLPTIRELCDLDSGNTPVDGVSLAPLLQDSSEELPDRKVVVQFSRMDHPQPIKGDAAVLWDKWRLVEDGLYHVGDDPGQATDVSAENPDVAAEMHSHYEVWWKSVEDTANRFYDLVIGDNAENPVHLTPVDWRDVFLDRITQIKEGLHRNGEWGIQVARPGRYRFELRRWPAESGLALGDPANPFQGRDRLFPGGDALNVRWAGLRVGDVEQVASVKPTDEKASFKADLAAGKATLRTWLGTKPGDDSRGAYYVTVERISDE